MEHKPGFSLTFGVGRRAMSLRPLVLSSLLLLPGIGAWTPPLAAQAPSLASRPLTLPLDFLKGNKPQPPGVVRLDRMTSVHDG